MLDDQLKCALSALKEPGKVVKDDALVEKMCRAIQKELKPDFVVGENFVVDFIRSTIHCDSSVSSWRHRDLFKIAFALLKVALADDESFSVLLKQIDVFRLVVDLVLSADFTDPIVKICCLQFISSCVSRHRGWIDESGVWKSCVLECAGHPSVFVAREAQNVASGILLGAGDCEVGRKMAVEIAAHFEQLCGSKIESVNDDRHALGFAGIMCTTLENLLKSDAENPSWLSRAFLGKILGSIEKLLVIPCDEKLVNQKSPLLLRLQILSVYLQAHLSLLEELDPELESDAHLVLIGRIAELLEWNASHDRHDLLATLGSVGQQVWHHYKSRSSSAARFDFERTQLFLVSAQVAPILAYFFRFHVGCLDGIYKNLATRLEDNDPRYKKVVDNLRKSLKDLSPAVLTRLTIQAAHALRGIAHFLCKENAIFALQSAMIIIIVQGYICNPASPPLQVAAIELLSSLLSWYRFTLGDAYESVCIIYMLCYLCDRPDVSTRVLIMGYKVLQQALKTNALPLEIALSHSETSCKTFSSHYLARSLKSRAGNTDWELRDSVLETLTAFVEASGASCIPLQAWLAEHKMLYLAVDALNDVESYVRASGYRLLAAAVDVPDVWQAFHREHGNFVEHAVSLILSSGEVFCRREALKFLIRLCERGKIQTEDAEFSLICSSMVHVCFADLDWESKRNALDFWRWCVHNEMKRVGMIDGEFPPTTFDMALNRIIDVTPEIAREKMFAFLEALCAWGCVDCLLEAVQDLEMTVRDKANFVLDELLKTLDNFNLIPADGEKVDVTGHVSETNGNVAAPRAIDSDGDPTADDGLHADVTERDAVIDSLLDGSDEDAVWRRMTLPIARVVVGGSGGLRNPGAASKSSSSSASEFRPRFTVVSCLEEMGRLRAGVSGEKSPPSLSAVASPLESYLDDILINFGIERTNPHADPDDVPMDCY